MNTFRTRPLIWVSIVAGICLVRVDVGRADSVSGNWTIIDDSPLHFAADAILRFTDSTNPPDGFEPELRSTVAGANWMFKFGSEGGPGQISAKLRGWHLVGPHAGEIKNWLPEISMVAGTETMPQRHMAMSWQVDHPGVSPPHQDEYGFEAWSGPPDRHPPTNRVELTYCVRVDANHRGHNGEFVYAPTTVGAAGGSTVSYDAASGLLSFAVGPVALLGSTSGIARQYAADTFRTAQWTASPIHFLGQDPDGRFRFSAGTNVLTDPSGQFTFRAGFDNYFVRDTSQQTPLSSYASVSQFVMSRPQNVAPSFLGDFVAATMHGRGMNEGERELYSGLVFTFITTSNLADATAGFTRSISNFPATFLIAGSTANGSQLALDIHKSGSTGSVSWPAIYSNAVLQTTVNLSSPQWATNSQVPALVGNQWIVSAPATAGAKYYRLVVSNADTNPPTFVSVLPDVDSERITLTFSEPVDELSATNLHDYYLADNHFNPILPLDGALSTPQSVELFIDPPLLTGTNYYLGVSGVRDLAGNLIRPITLIFTNSIPDATPPTLGAITPAASGDSITLTFSEPVDELSATDLLDYYLSDSLFNPITPLDAILSAPDSVELLIDPPLVSGASYYIGVEGVEDLAGNVMAPVTRMFTAP